MTFAASKGKPLAIVGSGLFERNLDLGKTARRRRVHCRSNLRKPGPDELPTSLAEDDDRDSPSGQLLLVSNVSIGGEEELKSGSFGCIEKFAVLKGVPAMRARFFNGMTQ